MRVNVYVDGFNLYYGVTRGQPYKWLDTRSFAASMLRDRDVVNRVCYCTAIVDGNSDPDAPVRQRNYIRALETTPGLHVEYGMFYTTYPRMALRNGGGTVQVIKSEEKGSDVNLAAHLMRDAFRNDFEAALVVTNDSDLVTPIQMVTKDLGLPVGVAMPLLNRNPDGTSRKPSVRLRVVASFERLITDNAQWRRRLRRAQFPETMSDAAGRFTRPSRWGTPPF